MGKFLEAMRMLIFPPESRIELLLRVGYHYISRLRFIVLLRMRQANKSYAKWKRNQTKSCSINVNDFSQQPTVTFLIPYYPEEKTLFLITLQSIQNLENPNWQVLIIDSGDLLKSDIRKFIPTNQPNIQILIPGDKEIRNLYKEIKDDYFLHCFPGDKFSPDLLAHFYSALNSTTPADVYFFDCEYKSPHETLMPFFKPTAFSPELLLSINYLSRGIIRTFRAVEISELLNFKLHAVTLEYSLFFRLYEQGAQFRHIPKVLVSQFDLFGETRKGIENEIQNEIKFHLLRSGLTDVRVEDSSKWKKVTWHNNNPSISIIIPSRNNFTLLKNLINTIIHLTKYSNYTITVVDNSSDEPELLDWYETLKKNSIVRVLYNKNEFNYSEAINMGAKETDSQLLLLLNNDMEVTNANWIGELAQWAIRPEIGVVGTKLLYKNKTIQHAGVILGLNGFMGHIYLNTPEHYIGLTGSVDWYRNYFAVTGACQMVRRDLFDSIGGYDEKYKLVFGDIDFCLRIHKLGFRNVYTPFGMMIHYEGASRGYTSPKADILRGYTEFQHWLYMEDPFFSPNLTYDPIPQCQGRNDVINERLSRIDLRKKWLLKGKR